MSRTEYYCAATLDGYIAESDDTLDWLTKYDGACDGPDAEPMKGSYDAYYDTVGALVMGSATYEFVLDEATTWPYAGKPTWVLSSRELPLPESDHDGLRFASGSIEELGPEIGEAGGEKALWVVGGGNVASQFAAAGLLDALIITVAPVVLGEGKPLFDERLPGTLQLTGTRAWDSGMVELRYELKR